MGISEKSSKLTDILSSLIEIQLTLAGEKELAGQNEDDRSNLKDPYVYGYIYAFFDFAHQVAGIDEEHGLASQIVIFDRIYGLSGPQILAEINFLMGNDTQCQKGMSAGSEDYRNFAFDHQNKKPEPRSPMSLFSYLIDK
tara:strand:+ start:1297 stop:1716 length:420 start_codon:yes stop_codon:yes gene_type:complete